MVAQTGTFIHGSELIEYDPPAESSPKKVLIFPLEIVFEDDFLAVINKPAGILVSGNKFKTIDNALPQNLRKSGQKDVVKPRPVHRLDYPTTGLLLIGKTSSAITALSQSFKDKEVSKTYYAVTIGAMKEKGVISSEIDQKEAVTYFEVLQTVSSVRFQFLNLVKLSPITGRRHQLRKHLSALGNPILGDKEYGTADLILNGKGLYLHAFSLEFKHPVSQEKMHITKKLPSKFTKLFHAP